MYNSTVSIPSRELGRARPALDGVVEAAGGGVAFGVVVAAMVGTGTEFLVVFADPAPNLGVAIALGVTVFELDVPGADDEDVDANTEEETEEDVELGGGGGGGGGGVDEELEMDVPEVRELAELTCCWATCLGGITGWPELGSRYQLDGGSPRHSPRVTSLYPSLFAWSIMYCANPCTVLSSISWARETQLEVAGLC